MQKNEFNAAKHCYEKALGYLVPNFEKLRANLLPIAREVDIDISDKMNHLLHEIAMIFGNQSLVMLKQRNLNEAILNAEHSVAYLPTAKVHTYIHMWLHTCVCTYKCMVINLLYIPIRNFKVVLVQL